MPRPRKLRLAAVLLVACLITEPPLLVSTAGAQTANGTTSDLVDRIQELYREGGFSAALAAADSLRAVASPNTEAMRTALEYRARCLVRLNRTAEAGEAFTELLRMAPDWRPDKDRVPPAEREVFARALAEMPVRPTPLPVPVSPPTAPAESEKPPATPTLVPAKQVIPPAGTPWWKTRTAIGGGVIATGAVVYLLTRQKKHDEAALPGPPPPPTTRPASVRFGGARQ